MSYKTIKTLTTWQPFLFKGNFIYHRILELVVRFLLQISLRGILKVMTVPILLLVPMDAETVVWTMGYINKS